MVKIGTNPLIQLDKQFGVFGFLTVFGFRVAISQKATPDFQSKVAYGELGIGFIVLFFTTLLQDCQTLSFYPDTSTLFSKTENLPWGLAM